jgi:hypothetical protein
MPDQRPLDERHEAWVRKHLHEPAVGQGEFGPDYWAHHVDMDADPDELFADYVPTPVSAPEPEDDLFIPPA